VRGGNEESEAALCLARVDCITLRAERWIEEAPGACKAVEPVVAAQEEADLVQMVAWLRPVLTFKA
jgi:tRNA-splicing ligase RtcB (3'-phosphate/5'-hydroxy nucleic acid ligase)